MAGRRVSLVRRDLILAAVREAGRISRAELAARTGMTRATITGLAAELLAAGLLAEAEATAGDTRRGRPAQLLTLGPGAGDVVAAVTGDDGVRVAVASLTGEIRLERHWTTSPGKLSDLIAEFSPARVWATVIGDERSHAALALVGEAAHGVAAGRRDVCYVHVGAGIRCGLMFGGHVHPGGDIGHVQVDESGALCRCGKRGCLATVAEPGQILAKLEAAEPGAVAAERLYADAGWMLGKVLANLANTVNPELFVLGGPLIEEGGPIVAAARDAVRHYAQPEVVESTEIKAGVLGDRAALLGAITSALRSTPAERGRRNLGDRPVMEHERAVRRDMIVTLLRTAGPAARSDIVKQTRLPRTAVADLLAGLEREGVVEAGDPQARSGRPSPRFRLAAAPGVLLGLAVERDGVRALLTDRNGTALADRFLPKRLEGDGPTVIEAVAGFARRLVAGREGEATVALSFPSPVHPVTGWLGSRTVLPMFSGFSPARQLSELLGCPVVAANNVQLAALAEARRGAGKGARDLLYLRAEAYCGAGIVAGGRSYPGAIGYAGEIGHLNVREMGPFCLCGKRGCLSPFLLPERVMPGTTEDSLIDLASAGDRAARKALRDVGRLIGQAVAVLCDALGPAVVVVGGRFTVPGPFAAEGIESGLRQHGVTVPAVLPAALGTDAEALGAIELLL